MRIYVHGNCQAPALGDLIAEACGSAVEVVARQVYSIDLESEWEAYQQDVALADVILTQPIANGYRDTEMLSTSWIRENSRRDARIFVFPVVYHRGQIPQCFTLADFHDGRLAYHDAHALEHFLRGESSESFVEKTARSDFLPESFVRSELAMTTLELLRRERAGDVDVPVSDIIASRLLTEQPLHTVNHPSRRVLTDLANRILSRLGRDERASPDGIDMLDRFIMPPYLSVALGLEHSGRGLWLDDVRMEGVIEKRPEFFKRVFDSYAEIGAPALQAAMNANTEMTSYLVRYNAAVSSPTATDMGDFAAALYRVFFGREASTDEKLHHLQTLRYEGFDTVVSSFLRSSEFLASGGGAALQSRFDLHDTMPVVEPNIHIPHPAKTIPQVKRTTLKSRMRAAYRVLVGQPDPYEPATEFVAVTSQEPQPAQPGETPAISTPEELNQELFDVFDTREQPPLQPVAAEAVSMEVLAHLQPGSEPLTIVVPMAGRGSRFANVGYTDPKPLIPVDGQPMIKVVIDNLTPSRPHRFIFVCQSEHVSSYGLVEKLSTWAPGSIVVEIDDVTEGAACTVLTAREHIGAGPLMIANSDQFVEVAIDDYLGALDGGLDGLIMTMSADDPKWSYAAIREDGLVSRVVEKEVISDQATVGIYNFLSGSDFVAGADRMIAANQRVNGEFYVAPVYNELINQGRRIGVFNVGEVGNGMFGLGTPEDLNMFLAQRANRRGAA